MRVAKFLDIIKSFGGYLRIDNKAGYKEEYEFADLDEKDFVPKKVLTDYVSLTSSTVADISSLELYAGESTILLVKDTLRGGVFSYSSDSLTVDNGIVFTAAGKGSGVWKRIGTLSVCDAAWWGVSPDSTQNGLLINRAVNSPYVNNLSIGYPEDVLLIEQPIYITRDELSLDINCTLKHPNETTYPLTATAGIGDTNIYVEDADEKFAVGQVVSIYSTAAPIGGVDAGENWPIVPTSKITAVTSTYVTVQNPVYIECNIANSPVIFNSSAIIIMEGVKNIAIQGGVIDGNKANAYFSYPRIEAGETDNANIGISVINCTDIYLRNLEIRNFRLHGTKWTNNNYRIHLDDSYISHSDSKNIIVNYGGSGFYINNVTVDRSEYEDNINFNGDIVDYTLDDIFLTNIKSSNAGRWGLRNLGANPKLTITGFVSKEDGGALQIEGDNSKLSDIFIKDAADGRYVAGNIVASLILLGDGSIVDNLTIDGVGAVVDMIRYEGSNIKISNAVFRNMPTAVSSGKTIHRGLAGAANIQITNCTYLDIDQTKIFRNTSGGAYFGDLSSSVVTISMLDRPNFSGSTVARNRFGNYASINSTLTVTDLTSGIDINTAQAITWDAATPFPLDVNRSSGTIGFRAKRAGTETFGIFTGTGTDLTFRTATGTLFSTANASTVVAFTSTPTAPTAAAATNTTALATTAHVFAERSNTFALTNKTISGAGNTLSNIGNASLTNSSIIFATPGATGLAPNWTTSPVSLGGTATLNIPNAATASVTGGLLSKAQFDAIALTATTPTITSGVAAPASTPGKIGDIYIDTVARKMYFAVGATNSGDWEIAN